MKLNINFLQTGGVPLTADLMDNLMEAVKFYDLIGAMAGNLVILTGCEITGTSITPGVVAINGECYYHEGGLITSTVFIQTQKIHKTFQDQTDKILIERKTVKFGTSTPGNTWNWSDFYKLDDLKTTCEKAKNAATQTQIAALLAEILLLKIWTAPIAQKKVRFFWMGDIASIPAGWEVDTEMQGLVPVGVDPNDTNFNLFGKKFGEKKHLLTPSEAPKHKHRFRRIGIGTEGGNRWGWIPAGENETGSNGTVDIYTSEQGGDIAHNNIQPSIAGYWIKPS